jgi:tRNA threonylcarbamoyl adenosine modification protein YeaZ
LVYRKLILSIDTSTLFLNLSLLLYDGKEEVFSSSIEIKNHASHLPIAIDELLKKGKVSLKDLDAISVISGPGSFTGLRVGIATALGLKCGLKIPLYSISSLSAIALHSRKEGRGIALIDARRGEFYSQCFKREKDVLTSLCSPFTVKYEAVKDLTENLDWGVALIPDSSLSIKIHSQIKIFRNLNLAEIASKEALKRFLNGDKGEDLVNPRYIRDADAVIQM